MDASQIHLQAVRHKVSLEKLTNHDIQNTTIEFGGRDTFNNLWIIIRPNNEKAKMELDELKMELALEYREKVQTYVPVDPLQGIFQDGALKVRLARAGNFDFYDGKYTDEKPEKVWSRCTHSKTNLPEAEEKHMENMIKEESDTEIYAFDAVVSFAGAFVCAEGTMASIVCRSIYKYKQDLCTEDEYVVPDTSDCPTDL